MRHPARPWPRLTLRILLIGAVAVAVALAAAVVAVRTPADATSSNGQARTWVVHAVDDVAGNRWVSADTGTSDLTIQAGDTVEWRFNRAQQGHDLTSINLRSVWNPEVREFRVPPPTDPSSLSDPIRYTFAEPGQFLYECATHGTIMNGSVTVETTSDNQDPTANPTVDPPQGQAPLLVHFTANATDPDGDALTYLWDFGTGNATDRATTAHAMFVYPTPGSYTAKLSVSDGNGGTYERTFPITVTGNGGSPVVTANATPTSGPAPLNVAFTGSATDPQGGPLTYAWDFGVAGTTADTASTAQASWTYATAGTYTATLKVTDQDNNVGTKSVTVVVTGAGVQPLPTITATATPTSGTAPHTVAFSTDLTTDGPVRSYAHGLMAYPSLTGSAEMTRSRGRTNTSIAVTGLKPNADHMVHVHEKTCGDTLAGAHFRFDETKPFAEENEIWLYFTSDAQGRSGTIKNSQPMRAGPNARSIVVHDPDNGALRIGCVDLTPATDDLTYSWSFGDGSTAQGPDPTHTYTRAGTHTATVTVGSAHAGHGMGQDATTTASVRVTVAAPRATITAAPSGTTRAGQATVRFTSNTVGSRFQCRTQAQPWFTCSSGVMLGGLPDGRQTFQVRAIDGAGNVSASPAVRRWTVDRTGPVIRGNRPTGTVRAKRPVIRAKVTDRLSTVRRARLVLRVDGRIVKPVRFNARTGQLTWRPPRPLSVGRHTVRLVAVDSVGNRTVRAWQFRVRR